MINQGEIRKRTGRLLKNSCFLNIEWCFNKLKKIVRPDELLEFEVFVNLNIEKKNF